MKTWLLKKGSEKKFRYGHPWVFSNELAQSPKGCIPGELVQLQDFQGSYLATGYGHPNSLISFRTLTTQNRVDIDVPFFVAKLERAAELRRVAGVAPFSHRLLFAEGDYLPGLIIDRYRLRLEDGEGQAIVLQSSTAGMDQLLPLVFEALERFVKEESITHDFAIPWERTAVVVANDAKSRGMEGVAIEPKTLRREIPGFEPEKATLIMQPGLSDLEPVEFRADLIGGQKTGFFLDQRANVQATSRFLERMIAQGKKDIRILDLCCYIGQWGSQLAHVAASRGARAHVICVDSSAKALELAVANVESNGGTARAEKMDVLEGMGRLENEVFDIVICDPPAFVKKKKDLPTGTQAYFKLNRDAFRKTKRGGIFVTCSCSGLFTEEEFRSMLSRATVASGRDARWLARGSHGPDHPQRPEFPQGTYLKSWTGVV